ncbi:MAG: hypothetical protein KC486_00125 [Myxococcales bacterium]|nr:hypothetical protein [Myxococcales bacterium]
MSLSPLFILALSVAAIVAAGLAGKTRRLGFWLTIVVSVFLTPFVGFALAVLSGRRQWPGRKELLAERRRQRRRRLWDRLLGDETAGAR